MFLYAIALWLASLGLHERRSTTFEITVILLLSIIAIGVLMCSDPGQRFLALALRLAGWAAILCIILGVLGGFGIAIWIYWKQIGTMFALSGHALVGILSWDSVGANRGNSGTVSNQVDLHIHGNADRPRLHVVCNWSQSQEGHAGCHNILQSPF